MTHDDRSGAVISPSGLYRYRLWRRWDFDCERLCWVMLNPSTADASIDDPTIKRCIGFAKALGFGGIEVVNLFAWRATNPRQLAQTPAPVGEGNDEAIVNAASGCAQVIAGWGQHGWLHNRAAQVLELLDREFLDVYALHINADGSPGHPLYLSGELRPLPYSASALV